jgi:Ca-activated chloride channel family protein
MKINAPLNCLLVAVLLGVLMIPHSTGAWPQVQQLPSGSIAGAPTIIRVSSNLVMVPVSVTDAAGRPVDNLAVTDFRIEENAKPEPIAKLAEPGQTPLDLAVLFDISGSVNPRFVFEQEAATHFLERVFQRDDMVSIMAIAAEPFLVQEVTGDLRAALESLRSLVPTRGMTAFYDSVVDAARLLRKTATPDARRVEVVISDGEDNNSQRFQLSDALREVQRADCIFYAINPAGPSISFNKLSLRGHEVMKSLAEETGGWVFLPDGLPDLEGIFARISDELRAQYLLEYYSSNTKMNGEFRQIVVTVPGRPGLRIRARQGYYAPLG